MSYIRINGEGLLLAYVPQGMKRIKQEQIPTHATNVSKLHVQMKNNQQILPGKSKVSF